MRERELGRERVRERWRECVFTPLFTPLSTDSQTPVTTSESHRTQPSAHTQQKPAMLAEPRRTHTHTPTQTCTHTHTHKSSATTPLQPPRHIFYRNPIQVLSFKNVRCRNPVEAFPRATCYTQHGCPTCPPSRQG